MAEKWDWTLGRIAWVDVETTGLPRPWEGGMPLTLEVALVLTDGKLEVLDAYTAVIQHPIELLSSLDMPEVVKEMHDKNGLMAECMNGSAVHIREAEEAMISLLKRHPDPGGNPIVWGGFSPSAVDRPMLLFDMPRFYKLIHHRTIDVSSLKLVMRNWASLELPKDEAAHRALADTMESVRVARIYRRFLLKRERLAEVQNRPPHVCTT